MSRGGREEATGRRALVALAAAHGVRSGYEAYDHTRRRTPDEALVGVLAALGIPIDHPREAPGLLAEARAGVREGVLEPVLVHRPGPPVRHRLTLPARVSPDRVRVRVRREDGTVGQGPLAELLRGPARPGPGGGPALVEHRFVLAGDLAATPGYHRLEVEGPGVEASALVVSAPARAPAPERTWGVFSPLHAVRTDQDWGVGTYRELAGLGDWTRELGGSLVGTLPLNGAFLDGPFVEPSPYRPASRLAWNELYVEVTALPELAGCPEARRLLGSARFRRRLDCLRAAPRSDPAGTLAAKREVLELLAASLAGRDSHRSRALAAFLAGRPEIEAYARFRAATETLGPWPTWPGVRPGRVPARSAPEDRVRYHRYAQWVAETQLAGAAARGGLYLDLPVGVHPWGFDPWFHRGSFVTGASGGAPPDRFQAAGQNWGINPLHPEGVRRDHYRYPIALFRHAMRHAAVLRIDHVMGLHRLWCIPEGAAATEGAYVTYRAEELRAVAVLEASRAGTVLVGEDLGTVAPAVRAAMARDGMLRSHVHQFAATPRAPFPDPPRSSLASLATHDLPPFASWWAGLDIDDRARLGALSPALARRRRAERARLRDRVGRLLGAPPTPGQALGAFLLHLARGPAPLVMVDLEDLWGEAEPQNRPGTGPEEGNFVRRWSRTWPGGLRSRSRLLRLVDRARRQGGTDGAGDSRS